MFFKLNTKVFLKIQLLLQVVPHFTQQIPYFRMPARIASLTALERELASNLNKMLEI